MRLSFPDRESSPLLESHISDLGESVKELIVRDDCDRVAVVSVLDRLPELQKLSVFDIPQYLRAVRKLKHLQSFTIH